MDITVIGLGKLGLPSAVCLAQAGHKVMGYDTNLDHIEALQDGKCPIREPGLAEELEDVTEPGSSASSSDRKLFFTNLIEEAVTWSEFFFIIVPTPSTKEEPRFDNGYVIAALEAMVPALKKKIKLGKYFVIDIVSTVMPKTCDEVLIPMLEEKLGCEINDGWGLVYNPEFIALGDVMDGFSNPDLVLIGMSDSNAGLSACKVYCQMGVADKKIKTMSLVSAELTKLSLNYYVTAKISFANWLGLIATMHHGADIDDITNAIGTDSRIGKKYLRAGPAFGGPCFPRDVRAMRTISPPQFQHEVNEQMNEIIAKHCRGDVAILGMAYKPGTHVTEESPSMTLVRTIGHNMRWSDPLTKTSDLGLLIGLGDAAIAQAYCEDPYEACKGASTVVVMTDDVTWLRLNWKRIVQNMKQHEQDPGSPVPTILDPWRMLRCIDWDNLDIKGAFDYTPLGIEGTNKRMSK